MSLIGAYWVGRSARKATRHEVKVTWVCVTYWGANDPPTVPKRCSNRVFTFLCVRCSSRTCVFLHDCWSVLPMRIQSLMKMLPNVLKGLSYGTEFAHIGKCYCGFHYDWCGRLFAIILFVYFYFSKPDLSGFLAFSTSGTQRICSKTIPSWW